MYKFGLSRKQCGVIFANIKRGNLTLGDDFSNWMYNNICDKKVFCDNTRMADVFGRMKSGLDAIFAGDMESANAELNAAYSVFHAYYAEA